MGKLDIINKKRYKTCPNFENKYIKGKDLIMSKLDKEQVIASFTAAYTAANGKAPTIEAKSGWYNVDGGKNMRLADLDAMIVGLASPASAEEAPAVVEKAKKVAVKKPAADKKIDDAPVKKKAKKLSFSVKAFWAEHILKKLSDSKTRR